MVSKTRVIRVWRRLIDSKLWRKEGSGAESCKMAMHALKTRRANMTKVVVNEERRLVLERSYGSDVKRPALHFCTAADRKITPA